MQTEFKKYLISKLGSELAALKALYSRPVNSVGQVPNSGKDVGATAVLCEDDKGAVLLL